MLRSEARIICKERGQRICCVRVACSICNTLTGSLPTSTVGTCISAFSNRARTFLIGKVTVRRIPEAKSTLSSYARRTSSETCTPRDGPSGSFIKKLSGNIPRERHRPWLSQVRPERMISRMKSWGDFWFGFICTWKFLKAKQILFPFVINF